jgi:integrase
VSKRSNGEGSIYQRGDGRWCAAIVAEDAVTGRRKRTVLYGRTRAEVRAKLKAAAERVENGAPVKDAKTSVAAWCKHWRATTLLASDRKGSTKELYRRLSERHIESDAGPLGAMTLDKLRPTHIEAFTLALVGRGLSESTIRTTYTVLRIALDSAVRDGLIARNPAAAVGRPAVSRKEARYLSSADVDRLLKEAAGTRTYAAIALIAATGLRKGEALALRWNDIDLEAGVLRVRGTLARTEGQLVVTLPKTRASRRTLRLAPPVSALLRAHRKAQAAERIAAANTWNEAGYVFTTESGQPIDPRNFLRALEAVARRAGLEHVGVHTLRHSAASALLEAGIGLKTVSEMLGHSSVAITGDVYQHVSDGAAQAAADALSAAIGL